MITAKKAIDTAINYVIQFYPGVTDIQLEEIELSDDESHWAITVSMPDSKPEAPPITFALSGNPRKYKILNINANTGTVKAMKIRKL